MHGAWSCCIFHALMLDRKDLCDQQQNNKGKNMLEHGAGEGRNGSPARGPLFLDSPSNFESASPRLLSLVLCSHQLPEIHPCMNGNAAEVEMEPSDKQGTENGCYRCWSCPCRISKAVGSGPTSSSSRTPQAASGRRRVGAVEAIERERVDKQQQQQQAPRAASGRRRLVQSKRSRGRG